MLGKELWEANTTNQASQQVFPVALLDGWSQGLIEVLTGLEPLKLGYLHSEPPASSS